ncbi:MAG: glycosyltransferase involved in cell wall biosynthesis [Paracoccaceae bacterium]
MPPSQTEGSPPFVIVSHPSRQGYVYRVPMAAQLAKLQGVFLTGTYYKPEKPAYRLATSLPFGLGAKLANTLEKRRLPELDPKRVISVSGALPEILPRLSGSYRPSNTLHDRLAARWLEKHGNFDAPVVAHGFADSSSHFLGSARRLGATTLLEMTLPPWGEEIIAPEYDRLGYHFPRNRQLREHQAEIDQADYIVAQNAFSVDWLNKHNIALERIALLPLGVDTERFHPLQDREQDPDRPFRVIFVGHQSIRKGLHILLEAWRDLALDHAELLLVGPITNDIGKRLHEEYAGTFTFVGMTQPDRLAELYRSADLLVCPSLFEGGPMVVLEAMASGIPCIVSNSACSVVRDGTDGIIVPVADSSALADAIVTLYNDRPMIRRMGIAARERALAFTWKRFYHRLSRFYRMAAAGERPENGFTDLTTI